MPWMVGYAEPMLRSAGQYTKVTPDSVHDTVEDAEKRLALLKRMWPERCWVIVPR